MEFYLQPPSILFYPFWPGNTKGIVENETCGLETPTYALVNMPEYRASTLDMANPLLKSNYDH